MDHGSASVAKVPEQGPHGVKDERVPGDVNTGFCWLGRRGTRIRRRDLARALPARPSPAYHPRVIVIDSPIGRLGIEASAAAITRILFHARGPASPVVPAGVVSEAQRQLAEYFHGERRRFDLPLAPEGTPFQQAVWTALQGIPYGQSVSYSELARQIGRPSAVRAVGAANGQNPIPIVIPCHRVIGADGRLVGFGGGLAVKEQLLRLERGGLF